ncbi:dTDP-4-dehydrorhamnose reductase [Fretibacter rubidus]|uniref:dTDP-4-dehydrorhamnose reductase n=1 Tax=Fretibacter rubidus TaxID=570162 RepID=UPI00352A0F54
MRLAVIGKTGQLAKAMAARAPDAEYYGRDALDLTWNTHAIENFILNLDVDAVIIAAAYTAVDAAETDSDTAFAVNAVAPGIIAKACADKNIALIHISTDYVFNGQGTTPYSVDAPTDPLGVYGASKLQGEQAVTAAYPQAAIVRTSWVYDGTGANFFNTMLRLGGTRDMLSVVHDQIGRPTFSGHLARAVLDMVPAVMRGDVGGVFHVSNTGAPISWADFARAIFDITARHRDHSVTVNNIPSRDYPTPAARPAYSVLETTKFESQFGALPDWQSGLKDAYKEWVTARA